MKFWMMPALLLVVAMAPAVAADGPSYDYLEAGYSHLDPDDASSVDGFGLGASRALFPHAHVVADYERLTGSGPNAHLLRVAVGMNSYIDHRSDFVARIGYARSRAGGTNQGFLAETGARVIFAGRLEVNGFVTYYDDSIFGEELTFSLGGIYAVSDCLGLSARVEASTKRTQLQARLRYSL